MSDRGQGEAGSEEAVSERQQEKEKGANMAEDNFLATPDAETERLRKELTESIQIRTEERILDLEEFCRCGPYLAVEYMGNAEAAAFMHSPIEGMHWKGSSAVPDEENRSLLDDLLDSILEFGLINRPKLMENPEPDESRFRDKEDAPYPYLILVGNQRRRALNALHLNGMIRHCRD